MGTASPLFTSSMSSSQIVVCDACGTKNRVPSASAGRTRCAKCHADLPWLVETSSADFADVVESSPLPVLVDAWAPWCPPCRMVGPIVERLAHRYAGRLKVAKLNVDDSPDVASRLGVQGIPALFLYRDGRVVDHLVGAAPESTLAAMVDRVLAESNPTERATGAASR
jgi:thioredoxin 2